MADFLVRDLLKMPAGKTRTVYAPEVKRKVLAYFARFEAVVYTSAPVVDAFTGEIVGDAMNGCSDGEYRWYLDEVYHFDKYDMKLSDDLIEHVIRAS